MNARQIKKADKTLQSRFIKIESELQRQKDIIGDLKLFKRESRKKLGRLEHENRRLTNLLTSNYQRIELMETELIGLQSSSDIFEDNESNKNTEQGATIYFCNECNTTIHTIESKKTGLCVTCREKNKQGKQTKKTKKEVDRLCVRPGCYEVLITDIELKDGICLNCLNEEEELKKAQKENKSKLHMGEKWCYTCRNLKKVVSINYVTRGWTDVTIYNLVCKHTHESFIYSEPRGHAPYLQKNYLDFTVGNDFSIKKKK